MFVNFFLQTREISQEDRRILPEHRWWRRMYESQMGDQEPESIYVYADARPDRNNNVNIDSDSSGGDDSGGDGDGDDDL